MRRFTVHQVVDTHLTEVELAEAFEKVEDTLVNQGVTIQFHTVQQGYDGSLAHLGAVPGDWVGGHIPRHGAAVGCTCEICAKLANGKTCRKDCAGWYIDDDGELMPCEECGLYEDGEEVSSVLAALIDIHGVDLEEEGWCVIFANDERWEIEKDDDVSRFEYDEDAINAAILKFLELTGLFVGPRNKKETPATP